jgi:hypothetical protein
MIVLSWLALARAPECGVCSEKSELRKCGEAALKRRIQRRILVRKVQPPWQDPFDWAQGKLFAGAQGDMIARFD